MADCAEIQDRLYSFATGECDPGTAKAIRVHIARCSVCAAELVRVRKVVHLTGLLEKVKPSHDLYPAVEARIHSRFYWLQVAGAAAAAVVLTVTLLYTLFGPVKLEQPATSGTQAQREEEPGRIEIVDRTPAVPEQLPGKQPKPVEIPEKDSFVEKKPEIGPQDREREFPGKKEEKVVKVPEAEPGPEQAAPGEPKPGPEPEKPVALARIGRLTGEVRVKREGGEEWLEAGALFCILPGDTFETNSLGRARIDFEGGDYFYINNNTHVALSEEEGEVVLKVEKGEVYCEKDSAEGSVAVDTGFGRVRCRKGAFGVKMFGKRKCLLHVISGEVECCQSDRSRCGKHGDLTRAWFQDGRRCQKGTKLRSKEAIRWAAKLRPKREKEKPDGQAAKLPKRDKPDDSDIPPGAVPRPADKPGQKPGQPGTDEPGGKIGPEPCPMPDPGGGGSKPGQPPGGGGSNPGGGGNQPGQTPGGAGGCPGGSK